jgi:lipoprotein-anchoring transpeptidase ErfK/SrfK
MMKRKTPRTSSRDRSGGGAAVLVVCGFALIAATTVVALRAVDSESAPVPAASADTTTTATSAPSTTASAPTTTTTPPTTAPPVTAAPTTTVPLPPPPPSYRVGDSGPEVAALQQRLIDLGFWIPGADGNFGAVTGQAVMAFQKTAGLSRDGIAGPATLAALQTAVPPAPREGGDHIEVDLERQVMFVVRGGSTFVFNTSTGRPGWRTPPGRFQITRQIDGVRKAPLGDLYRPKYFNGGIALHGAPNIPGHPASHGCTRLHDAVVDLIWAHDLAPVGTPVWVY